RVLNAPVVGVVFWLPPLGSTSACVPRVTHGVEFTDVRNGKATPLSVAIRAGEALLGQGELLRGSFERLEVLEMCGACSRREDVAWSGGNAERSSVIAFFEEVVVLPVEACPGVGTDVVVIDFGPFVGGGFGYGALMGINIQGRHSDPYRNGATRRDRVASDRADASFGVAMCTAVATPAERQTHKMIHLGADHKPQTHHTGEGSMEKLSKLPRKHEELPIHPDREEHKQSLPFKKKRTHWGPF
ncbi:hypothetical protein Taro_031715, partial [Colocasia esculenta]|nr:hypothetical protein [Colocasia esculenta]